MKGNARHFVVTLALILASETLADVESERLATEATRYATAGGAIYRLHTSTPAERMFEALAAGETVVFEVAVPELGGAVDAAFDLAEMQRPGAIAWLAAPPGWPSAHGRWSTVLAARIAVEREALRIEYAAGDDRVAFLLPEHGLAPGVCGPTDVVLPPLVIEVNEERVVLAFDEGLRTIVELEGDPKGAVASEPLAALMSAFADGSSFFNAYMGAALLLDDLRRGSEGFPSPEKGRSPCLLGCVQCSAGALATTGSFLTLIGACGASVATAGATTPACIGAVMLHEATAWTTVVICAECANCQSRQRRQSTSCDCSQPDLSDRCQERCEPSLPLP